MTLHAKKIALLHVAKKQLALVDDDYRAILIRIAGVDSAADLSELDFERVLAEFNRLGFRSTGAARHFGHRPGFATPAQVRLIRELWREYHGDDPAESALNSWLAHYHRVSALRFVSADAARAILPGLKAMASRGRGQRTGSVGV